ncbi:MAG: hypothetical protein L6R40_004174 [Gallowayella cf. fulva]|nr:MAG: hypothetical protein L6R40_004174 [Xanthomendoza cf. fulva]
MRSFAILTAVAIPFSFISAISAQDTQGVSNYSPGDPLVNLINTSPTQTHVYKVEGNADNPGTAYGAGEGALPAATVLPGQTVAFHLGQGFIGALTAKNGEGTRFEVNFRGDSPGEYKTWYNSDMQFGMSDTTIGPAHGEKLINGDDSLAGEPDCLATANSAWGSLDEQAQQELLDTGYLEGTTGKDGVLTSVHMDKQAGDNVVDFYQNITGFKAYVVPGSVVGKKTNATGRKADTHTWSVKTKELTITGY